MKRLFAVLACLLFGTAGAQTTPRDFCARSSGAQTWRVYPSDVAASGRSVTPIGASIGPWDDENVFVHVALSANRENTLLRPERLWLRQRENRDAPVRFIEPIYRTPYNPHNNYIDTKMFALRQNPEYKFVQGDFFVVPRRGVDVEVSLGLDYIAYERACWARIRRADLNLDGEVNFADFIIFTTYFGKTLTQIFGVP